MRPVRTRLTIVAILAVGLVAAPAPAGAQAPTRAYTVARGGGEDLGYGPRARLKAWRDDAQGRLCFRLRIPFLFDSTVDGESSAYYDANRAIKCVPYPQRRALTWRPVAFNECYVGGRLLLGVVRSDVARVEVRRDAGEPSAAHLVRIPQLVPDGALVHAPLTDFNTITAYDAEGRELATTSWHSPYPGCPASGRATFL